MNNTNSKDWHQISANIKIRIPSLPNFITASVYKADVNIQVPIEDFSDEELIKIGKMWTAKLIESAQKRRKPKN